MFGQTWQGEAVHDFRSRLSLSRAGGGEPEVLIFVFSVQEWHHTF